MSNINRRSFIRSGILAGIAGSGVYGPVHSAEALVLQQGNRANVGTYKPPKIVRHYSAIDASGAPTHVLGTTITIPVPNDTTLDSTCWTAHVKITSLLPNPQLGFPGGTINVDVTGQDSVAAFLASVDLVRDTLESSQESQIGSVVWSDVPDALGYALQVGDSVSPCSSPVQPNLVVISPEQTPNSRITDTGGELTEIILVRDLERTDETGTKTLVRIIVGRPVPIQGVTPGEISYSCTYQIQGLQPQPNAHWPDGIITQTCGGVDTLGAITATLQQILAFLLSTSEGSVVGQLVWLPSPADRVWGLPKFDPNAMLSASDLQTYLDTLGPAERAQVEGALSMDWNAYFS